MATQGSIHNRDISSKESTGFDDWVRSDEYHNARLIKPDPHLDDVNKIAADNGMPPIAVSDAQGKLLNLIARSINAKKVLEVGTLAGQVGLIHICENVFTYD